MVSRYRRAGILGIVLACSIPLAHAQQQTPPPPPLVFATVSVKPSTADTRSVRVAGNQLVAQDVTLRELLEMAYAVYAEQLWSGVPEWGDSAKYDLTAATDPTAYPNLAALTREQRRTLLQGALASQFGLKLHTETHVFAVYQMLASKDGLRVATTQVANPDPDGSSCVIDESVPGTIKGQACMLDQFAGRLGKPAGRIVLDMTGVWGFYDFELHYTPADDTQAGWPPLFQALREQAGMKLEPEKAPMVTLVVDKVQQPAS